LGVGALDWGSRPYVYHLPLEKYHTMGVTLDLSGLKEIKARLNKISGQHEIPLHELMPDDFVRKNTRFDTLEALLNAGGIKRQEDLEREGFSNFITANSRFEGWKVMGQIALAGGLSVSVLCKSRLTASIRSAAFIASVASISTFAVSWVASTTPL
jgi:hypothetical protein